MRKRITLAEFRKITANIDGETLIVVPGPDHSYKNVGVEATTALLKNGELSEDFGEQLTPEANFGKRIQVILINKQ